MEQNQKPRNKTKCMQPTNIWPGILNAEKIVFKNLCWDNGVIGYSQIKETGLIHSSQHLQKVTQSGFFFFNVSFETIKLLEKHKCSLAGALGNYFLDMTPKAQQWNKS